ncbi:MAG: alpha-amylase family glycosyl hydrolase [Byssovorax sp.]
MHARHSGKHGVSGSVSRWITAAAMALPLAGGTGCMKFDDDLEGPIALETHAADWRDEVIYQVLIDRFADGDAGNDYRVDTSAGGKWHGGDWKGLEDHLDYLESLGVTALWISPVVKNVDTDAGFDGYHGYWAQDLDQPNPHFGDVPALRRMVAAAHRKNMKVILDIVTNHLGQLFYYDINQNGQPDENVAGNGCDKAFPGSPDPTCQVSSSGVKHVNEYDPDFDPRGIQSRTSLGESGPAPIIFVYDPASNHIPPMPEIFQSPEVYNRKGRTYNFDDPDQLLHGDFPGGLKDVNTTRCDVKQAMVNSYARWVELTDLDGFRIDTVKHVEQEFWRYFTQKVRQRLDAQGKKDFLMFGEAFDGNDELIGSFTKNTLPAQEQLDAENACVTDGKPIEGDQLDSVFYFSQYFTAMRQVFIDAQDTQRIADLWNKRPQNFGTDPAKNGIGISPQKALVNFLDNHDVGRFLFFSGTDEKGQAQLRNAQLLVMTEDGIPCVYYGTEQGFAGGNDPANREDLWPTNFDQSNSHFVYTQKLIALRKKYSALRKGDQKVVWATSHTGDEGDAGIFAYERGGGDAPNAYALVVFNTSPNHDSATKDGGNAMKLTAPPGTELTDVLNGGASVTVGADGSVDITLPALSGALYVPSSQVGGN